MKCNVDGAFYEDQRHGATGVVIERSGTKTGLTHSPWRHLLAGMAWPWRSLQVFRRSGWRPIERPDAPVERRYQSEIGCGFGPAGGPGFELVLSSF